MKIKNIILILICMFLLSACENDWLSTANLYTKNETDGEYIVYLRHNDTVGIYVTKNLKSVVLPYQKTQLIQSESGITPNTNREGPVFGLSSGYIYVLNRKDSTYFKFRTNDYTILDPTAYYYEQTEVDSKNKIAITNHYLTINDSLVLKMVKDKLVADSILTIWK